MINLSIPYGEKHLPLQIPEQNWGELLEPPKIQSTSFETGLRQALDHPLNSSTWPDFIAGCRSLLVLVNDETRPTPTGRVLEWIRPEISPFPIKIMVATGIHKPSSEEGCRTIFGRLWPEWREKILFHNCQKEGTMVFLGETSRGTRVMVNQELMMADRILIIGSVEPHYFAGYTGGRKAIIPGVAAHSTIVGNHALAMDLNAQPLKLAGNPVHEDLEEAFGFLTIPPVFSVMLVLTPDHRLYSAHCGSTSESLILAAKKADEVFTVSFREKSDILISVVYPPMDIDLYQSQKPIEHGKMALKEDGILILVMACPQGPGPSEFQELMLQSGDPQRARLLLYQPYTLGNHRLIRNLKFLDAGGQIWGITDLDPHFLSRTLIQPMASLQGAVNMALEQKGRSAKINVLFNAALCVPRQQLKGFVL